MALYHWKNKHFAQTVSTPLNDYQLETDVWIHKEKWMVHSEQCWGTQVTNLHGTLILTGVGQPKNVFTHGNEGCFGWEDLPDAMWGETREDWYEEGLCWGKNSRAAASAEQQTGGDVLLLGSTSHCFGTATEELQLPFHPPTPPPLPPQRTWYDMYLRMYILSL